MLVAIRVHSLLYQSRLRACQTFRRVCTKTSSLPFVPQALPVLESDIRDLTNFVDESDKLFVLTGAGISTESGLPDYRSKGVGLYDRTDSRPMPYQEFVKDAESRRRYWARNYVAWTTFSNASPNVSHRVFSDWEKLGKIRWLVTQNVDQLHQKAGTMNITELHGSTYDVICLSCESVTSRDKLQMRFHSYNADWHVVDGDDLSNKVTPDADIYLSDEQVANFQVPPCKNCGGVLKSDVVFFGDNVRRALVESVFSMVHDCDRLLVVGSSLHVYSGYRFLLKAAELGKLICIVNIGPTRADHLCSLKIDRRCGEILSQVILKCSR